MKQEHFEKPETLLKQIENVEFLLGVTIPWMEANPERVDFNVFNIECGTKGCLLGWYSVQRYELNVSRLNASRGVGWEFGEFGISKRKWVSIFGMKVSGTLPERKPRVQTHLADLKQQVSDWYKVRERGSVVA